MKNEVKTYRYAVCGHLACGPGQKRRLKKELSYMLRPLLEENPAPDRNMLYESLGAPETVAASLMKEVPTAEQTHWKNIHRGLIAVCAVAICTAFIYLFFMAAIKPIELTIVENETIIYRNAED